MAGQVLEYKNDRGFMRSILILVLLMNSTAHAERVVGVKPERLNNQGVIPNPNPARVPHKLGDFLVMYKE